jgi:4,5-DOPA dioxygenase extradiol
MSVPAPVLFIGHGSPMNALPGGAMAGAWAAIGRSLIRPKAVLVVSAHWETDGVAVTAMAQPRTIHDFRGFPQALFDMRYPAPGSPELAAWVASLLAPTKVRADLDWGLDHGAWSVLAHVFPNADVPVVQLSLDRRLDLTGHAALARRLAPLRDEGVLIIGSGDVVHNLRTFDPQRISGGFDWAVRFNDHIKARVVAGDLDALIQYRSHPDAALAAPDFEHYAPLIYAAALRRDTDRVEVLTDEIMYGSISMTSFEFAA